MAAFQCHSQTGQRPARCDSFYFVLRLLHLPTQIAHLGQMAAKRELGYLDFLEQALKDEAMARAERMRGC
ncbi:hypothetical protein FHX57_007461 [Paraburkholderia tropica]|nr:hypothetical protein [Paraburkholderia tropica]MBB3005073.1 hypothetical protein [Paraburkholderia tropica]MBB6323989.1 hypothetical protein [Paraburkholderia tropica]